MLDKEIQLRERIKVQDMAEQLSKENKHLLLQWATGVGKGKAVMQCIAASSSSKQWLVVVPEIIQIQNYKEDMDKHGYTWLLGSKIHDIICYASLHLYRDEEYNLALNEVHRVRSELRTEIVNSIKYDQIISDSATVSEEIQAILWEICPFYSYEIPLNKAINLGILPAPSVYKVPVRLDSRRIKHTITHNGEKYRYTDESYARRLDKNFNYWSDEYSSGQKMWQRNKMLRAASLRKEFLAGCKTARADSLIDELKDQGKRIVVFCGSVEQAEKLGGEYAIHSKKGKSHNLETIAAFNRGEISTLFFNKMGKEGMNLKDIDVGIIVQLDSGADEGLSFLQRTGRVLRGVEPDIYILYVPETQDEKYLNRALRHVDDKHIKTL